MARQIRKKSGTGIYHVMLRGINRQDIFEDNEDYMLMISILKGLTERRDEQGLLLMPYCTFYAYCLMSVHKVPVPLCMVEEFQVEQDICIITENSRILPVVINKPHQSTTIYHHL